jgi:sensor c-di-GMP phosphodiesterase-like protein
MVRFLARGGIEFLAVFLGIALSLWVDDVNKAKELEKQKLEVFDLLTKQTDELLLYTKSKLIEYERQADKFKNLNDSQLSIKFLNLSACLSYSINFDFV